MEPLFSNTIRHGECGHSRDDSVGAGLRRVSEPRSGRRETISSGPPMERTLHPIRVKNQDLIQKSLHWLCRTPIHVPTSLRQKRRRSCIFSTSEPPPL